jgi:putative endonuclease
VKNTRNVGNEYEKKALYLLKKHGFSEIQSNYYSRWGEIDLIVRKGMLLVFVEVKYRSRKDYGRGYESVNIKKQKKIYITAMNFLQKNKFEEFDFRFDVISFDGNEYQWIENCFWGDELGF